MTRVLSITERPADQQLVSMLEDLLGKAKSGELRFAAFAGTCAGGEVIHASGGEVNEIFQVLGAFEVVKRRLMERYVEL